MKDYFYMFSNGSYSDYRVDGLYSSKEELSKEYFANYLKTYMIQQVPEAKEFFEALDTDIEVLTGYLIPDKVYTYCTQDECPEWWAGGKEYWDDIQEYKNRRDAWLTEEKFSQDIAQILVDAGVLVKLEYEEIWNG